MIGYIATHKDDYNVGETYKVKGLPKVESELKKLGFMKLRFWEQLRRKVSVDMYEQTR